MTAQELFEGMCRLTREEREKAQVLAYIGGTQGVGIEEAWLDESDGDQFVLAPEGVHARLRERLR